MSIQIFYARYSTCRKEQNNQTYHYDSSAYFFHNLILTFCIIDVVLVIIIPMKTSFKNPLQNFFICGLTGWCMEILFTSTAALLHKDYTLTGKTSLWMFPIYGMAAVIEPLSDHLRNCPAFFRGIIYSTGIFTGEYISGSILRRFKMCPWDYSFAKSNINGIIRLDFAPLWMCAGLTFEKILHTVNVK